ncbi:uncharacterized protein [Phaseolus vulgaris]|uniref:uncharacterized protein n=1 Tax=Phaseolus vulgaris TaxID=3885 RepID=UPI0035CA9CCF
MQQFVGEEKNDLLDYLRSLQPEQNMCISIRKRQIIPHTGGVMSLSRRRNNLKIETGKNIGRAEMWKITHKRKNGTYVNDEALEIGASDYGSGAPSPNQVIGSSAGSKTN